MMHEGGWSVVNPTDHDRDTGDRGQKQSLLRRNWRPFYILLNIAVDAAAVTMAGGTAYAIREMVVTSSSLPVESAAKIVLTSCVVAIASALLCGLYRSAYRMPFAEQYREAGQAYVYAAFVIVFVNYISLGSRFAPHFTAFFLLMIPVFFVAGRTAIKGANLYLQKKGYGRHNSMILTWDGTAPNLPGRVAVFSELGYNVHAFACAARADGPCNPETCALQRSFAEVRRVLNEPPRESLPCYRLDELERAIDEEQIERLFVPMVKPVANGFSDIVRICVQRRVKLKVISRESDDLLRFSRVKDIAGISLYSPPKVLTNRIKSRTKRVFDVCGSLFLLILFSPFFVLVSLAILIEDGRPVFFLQRRASMKGGRTFNFLKFRGMVKDAETRHKDLMDSNQTEEGLFLLKDDPRVTKVGRWIRKYSLDELPQLLNVLRGDMSLVGPRPLSMSDLDNVSPDNDFAGYYYLRDNTRPGITGLWQICGRREVPFREMMLLDLYYIENQSIIFDLEILFATIPVVLFGRGAY